MREIGSLASVEDANQFTAHLRGLGISTRILPKQGAQSIWVHDENRIQQATEELQLFQANPLDPRFIEGIKAGKSIEQEVKRAEKQFRKNFVDLSGHWDGPVWKRSPFTIGLMAIAIGVGLATSLGNDQGQVFDALTFTEYRVDLVREVLVDRGLEPIKEGQVWRLVTPIFLHFGILHLLFNLMWIRSLGSMIEMRKGGLKFVALVLIVAVLSNYGQYYESVMRGRISVFGGLSGVVYGLFGYAWIRGQLRPGDGIGVDSRNVQMMIFWFFLCMTGAVGPIANSAHGVGLVVGMLMALTPL